MDETEKYVDRRFSSQMIIREFFGIDYSYDDYDIEELCTEFALFNYRIKCNVLPEHLD